MNRYTKTKPTFSCTIPCLQRSFLGCILSLVGIVLFLTACHINFIPIVPKHNEVSIDPSLYISLYKDIAWELSYFSDADSENIELIRVPIKDYEPIVVKTLPNVCSPILLACNIEQSANIEKALEAQPWGLIVPFNNRASPASTVASLVFFKLVEGSVNGSVEPSVGRSDDIQETLRFASFFNWQRLIERLGKESDPFLLDIDRMATDIANGTFSSKSIQKR